MPPVGELPGAVEVAAHLGAELAARGQPVVDQGALDGQQPRIAIELLEAERRLELPDAEVGRRIAVPVDVAVRHLRPQARGVRKTPGEVHLQAEVEFLEEAAGGVEASPAQIEAVVVVGEAAVALVAGVELDLQQAADRERRLLACRLDLAQRLAPRERGQPDRQGEHSVNGIAHLSLPSGMISGRG